MRGARFQRSDLDRAVVRRRLDASVSAAIDDFVGDVLDVGCGDMPYREHALARGSTRTYVGVDIPNPLYGRPDVHWDGLQLPFRPKGFDAVLLTEVLEHCPDPMLVLREIARALRPGGCLFLTVPFLWPLHDVPHDEYRFTPFSLDRLLVAAGFRDVEVRALGGWDAALAQMLGLWVRRRLHGRKRAIASVVVAPVIRYLDGHDTAPTSFTNSTMVTGLTASAVVPPRD